MRKRLCHLWPKLVSFQNLHRAFKKARRGKSRKLQVAAFELDLERNLFQLQHDLQTGDYTPGAYRLFTLYERKPRLIAAAPFRDRVVHHAILNLIEPPLDRRFIDDSYACRPGKGVHAAVDRYQGWSRRNAYVLKADIRRYFPSIDHDRLKETLRRNIGDPRVLALLDTIIDAGPAVDDEPPVYFPGDDLLTPLARRRGIPIGNLTSQFLANLYLDGFDHWVKEHLRVRPYLRYVDDIMLLDDDPARLADWRAAIRERLALERLRLHPAKAEISPTRRGLNLLGYTVFPDFRLLRNDNGHRFRRRLRGFARAYARHRLDLPDMAPSVHAWLGHARHADTHGLRRRLFAGVIFQRERAVEPVTG